MQIKPVRPPQRERRRLGAANPAVRRRLMNAAARLIAERGWTSLRIEDLVGRAGLSVGTFYLYFDSKADLFVELVLEHTERLRARLREAYGSDGTPRERLARALDAYFAFVTESESAFLHFRDAGNVETTVGPLFTWVMAQHVADLRPVLETGMEHGDVRQDDPELLAQAMVALNHNIACFWLEHKERYSLAEIKQFILNLVSRGLALPQGHAERGGSG